MAKSHQLLLLFGIVMLSAAIFYIAPSRNRSSALPAASARIIKIAAATPLQISLPMKGLKASDIQDTFDQMRDGKRKHEGTDIMAPRGTPILAVNDGKIVKLFLSKPGGITIYHFDPSEEYCYYYAHLDRYADGVTEGMTVHRGDVIGFVGSTGNANPAAPHLHFEIHQLEADKHWWSGVPLNPYQYLVNALPAAE